MKVKYQIMVENGFDSEDNHPTYKTVKTMKGERNEQNAIAFTYDARNMRRYGYMTLQRIGENGDVSVWNDEDGIWVGM